MEYFFKYRRGFFWKKIKVDGHVYRPDTDRMDLFFKDGTLLSIGKWSECDLRLGKDWLLRTKSDMEAESGLDIKLKKGV